MMMMMLYKQQGGISMHNINFEVDGKDSAVISFSVGEIVGIVIACAIMAAFIIFI